MSSIILTKHTECVIVEAPREGYYLLANNKTAWFGGLCVDFKNRTYKITTVFDHAQDKVSLGYFKEFLRDNGWKENTEE